MLRIYATDGAILFKQHDQTAAQLPDFHIPGATAYKADQSAGHFSYQTYVHDRYTIFRSSYNPSQDLTLRVDYAAPFTGFRIMLKNHIRHLLNDKNYYIMQGQANIVYAPTVYSELYLRKNEEYQVFDLQVSTSLLTSIVHKDPAWMLWLGKVNGPGTEAVGGGPGFISIQVMDTLEAVLKDPGNEALVIQLFEQVIEARTKKKQQRIIAESQLDSLYRVKGFIKEQITGKFHLRDWARMAGMNITYFKELFKEIFGITPYHYLMYERIRAAKQMMLEYPHLSLAEVAQACGFSNYNNLRRAFFAVENITLSRWQKLSDITGVLIMLELFR